MTEITLTNSELRTWQVCKRKWYLTWGLGYAPNPATESPFGVMHLGSCVHLALEAYYGYGIDPLAALNWAYSDDIFLHPECEEVLEKELNLARIMVEGFVNWVAAEGLDAGLDVLATEVPVEHRIEIDGQGVILKGKLDQLARRKSDGALLARDFKTVGSLAKATQLRSSSQLKFYALIQALSAPQTETGEIVAGGEYLLLARTKRTDRATPPFYARVEVPLNKHELNAQYQMTMALVREILQAKKSLQAGDDHHEVVYPHFGDWCGWGCNFTAECSFMDDGSRWQDALAGNFVQRDKLAYYSTDRITSLRAALA